MTISYDILPEHMQAGTRRYVEKGIMPGDFLYAVLCNDLTGSFSRADGINSNCMRTWARWLYSDAPNMCWGSPDIVRDWCEKGGLEGIQQKRGEEE